MKVHITLVGGQPAPVYHGYVATMPDKIVYIYSKESTRALELLKSEIKIDSEEVLLDSTNPIEILKKAQSLSDKYINDDVTVNISSGTKAWTYFFSIVFASKPNAAIVYMDQNNVLWNYKDMTSLSNFKFDMFTLFRLYGNNIEKNYVYFSDYTDEELKFVDKYEKVRNLNYSTFNNLTTALQKDRNNKLKQEKSGRFEEGNSFIEWIKPSKTEPNGYIHICLYNKKGDCMELEFSSPHAVNIAFNSGWFELKVAHLLSKWDKVEDIIMNCRFNFKPNLDKNEVDVIVNTGTKLLFVECKTQISKSTDINKFSDVVKNYGGMGSKGIFITEVPMSDLNEQKCKDARLLSYTVKRDRFVYNDANKLYKMLDDALWSINTK